MPDTARLVLSATQDFDADRRDARFRRLRDGAFIATLLDLSPLPRFWLSEPRRLYLFLSLMQHSAWMRGGDLGCFSCTGAAVDARMSLARVSQLLDMACATGDFVRRRDPRDSRHYVFDPSEAAISLFLRLSSAFHADAAALLGREFVAPAPGSPAERQAHRRFLNAALQFLSKLDLGDRGVGSLSFLLAVLDLHLHRPIAITDFVRRESERLNVSGVTVRNLLRRAEERKWLCRHKRMILLSARGNRAVLNAMEDLEDAALQFMEGSDPHQPALRAQAAGTFVAFLPMERAH